MPINILGLELGSGSGFFSEQMMRYLEFRKLHLVDISKRMLEKAKVKLKINEINYENLDFDKYKTFNKFNFIYSNMSLHWSENFNLLFENLLNSMSKGSIILFSVPNCFEISKGNSSLNLQKFLNKFPDVECNLKKIKNRKKFFIESKIVTFTENFNGLLNFFYKLKKIGANISFKRKKENLISFRRNKSKITVMYIINFVIIKKL